MTDKRFRFALALVLAEARSGRGISQTDLAAALGISQGEVSRLERAVYAVSVERFVAWCAACGHSSSYVLEQAQLAARTMPATVTTYRKARAWRELA